MNLADVITQRRSVRAFTDRPVPREALEALLEAARLAPSGGNTQPWHFYAITSPAEVARVVEAATAQPWPRKAQAMIVVCALPDVSAKTYHERGAELYCLQDTAAAIEHILLTAHDRGLASCWVGAFDEAAAQRALSMPEGHRAVAMLPIGYPAEAPPARPRKPLAEVVTYVE